MPTPRPTWTTCALGWVWPAGPGWAPARSGTAPPPRTRRHGGAAPTRAARRATLEAFLGEASSVPPRASSMVEVMQVKIGCCGFAMDRRKYYGAFPVVEVQQTFYQLP